MLIYIGTSSCLFATSIFCLPKHSRLSYQVEHKRPANHLIQQIRGLEKYTLCTWAINNYTINRISECNCDSGWLTLLVHWCGGGGGGWSCWTAFSIRDVGQSMLSVLTRQFIDFAAVIPVLDLLVAESVLEQVGLLERLRLGVSMSSRCFTSERKV